VIPRFITAALNDESPVIFGDGEQSRDFTYIDNTVDGTLLASTAEGAAGETFNVACGEATTLNQLLEHIREISGKPVEAIYEERQPGDLQRSQADITRARQALGYDPAVDVRTGLERTFVQMAAGAEAAARD
jgi:UDP-glucose 4-epimerase